MSKKTFITAPSLKNIAYLQARVLRKEIANLEKKAMEGALSKDDREWIQKSFTEILRLYQSETREQRIEKSKYGRPDAVPGGDDEEVQVSADELQRLQRLSGPARNGSR